MNHLTELSLGKLGKVNKKIVARAVTAALKGGNELLKEILRYDVVVKLS